MNVLIVTPSNFLAKTASVNLGIHFDMNFNQEENSYISFDNLLQFAHEIEDPTVLFIVEVDDFFFKNPIATSQNTELDRPQAIFKTLLIKNPTIKAIVGLTATFDTDFGQNILKQLYDNLFIFKSPTMKNMDP
jgi:hypothetical protein